MGAITAAQGLAAQAQINFTRENEYEADRVGIGVLAAAGFDPNAMPAFFETMGRRTQLGPDRVPELLRTHPVTSARIAESKGRAAQYPPVSAARPHELFADHRSGSACSRRRPARTRARTTRRVIGERAGRQRRAGLRQGARPADRGRRGSGRSRPSSACATTHPEVMQFHTALGQAQLSAGDAKAALDTLERARELAPRNVPVTVRYGEALLQAGRPKRAHEVLLDLFNNVPPTQEQIRLTAIAANAAGDVADAYSYMAEYHLMGGDLPLAINQLELALSVPGITDVQRARFVARLKELREALPKERAAACQRAATRRRRPEAERLSVGTVESRRAARESAAWRS